MSNEKMNGESVRMLYSEAEHVSRFLGGENWVLFLLDSKQNVLNVFL